MFPADVWIIISGLLRSEQERRPLRQTCKFLREIIPYSQSRAQKVVANIMGFISCCKVDLPITMSFHTSKNEIVSVTVDWDNRIMSTDTKKYKKVSVWKDTGLFKREDSFWMGAKVERYDGCILCGPVFRYEGNFPAHMKFSDLLGKQKRPFINRVMHTYKNMYLESRFRSDHFYASHPLPDWEFIQSL